MLTKVLVYAYCVGVFSSRKMQQRLLEDVAFRLLAADNRPDFRTIADFRKRHLAALQGLFEQVLRLARELGLPRVGRVAIEAARGCIPSVFHVAIATTRVCFQSGWLGAKGTDGPSLHWRLFVKSETATPQDV